MQYIKKQNVFGWLLCLGAVLSLVSMIIYISNSTTGFLSDIGVNAFIVTAPVLAILGSVALFLFSDKLDERLVGLATFVIGMLIAIACTQYIVVRVDAIGALLNPIPHPDAEIAAVNQSITGIVFYAVTMLVYVAITIGGRLTRKTEV